MRLLLVDDAATNRLTLAALLEEDGHVVVEAQSCAEARARLSAEPFDAVLLDLGLPDGDGSTLIPEVRAMGNAKVLVISGSDVSAVTARADGVLAKGAPYAALQALLQGSTGA